MGYDNIHMDNQCLVSISNKTCYRKISRSLEAAGFVFRIVRSLWNLTGTSAAVLPRRPSNFKRHDNLTFQSRGFTRSYDETSYRILNGAQVFFTLVSLAWDALKTIRQSRIIDISVFLLRGVVTHICVHELCRNTHIFVEYTRRKKCHLTLNHYKTIFYRIWIWDVAFAKCRPFCGSFHSSLIIRSLEVLRPRDWFSLSCRMALKCVRHLRVKFWSLQETMRRLNPRAPILPSNGSVFYRCRRDWPVMSWVYSLGLADLTVL